MARIVFVTRDIPSLVPPVIMRKLGLADKALEKKENVNHDAGPRKIVHHRLASG